MSPADRLAHRALELIDVPSESRDEAALAAHVLDVLTAGGVAVRDAGVRLAIGSDSQVRVDPLIADKGLKGNAAREFLMEKGHPNCTGWEWSLCPGKDNSH